jgi:SnoaL-like domain
MSSERKGTRPEVMMPADRERSTREVVSDHLARRKDGKLEEDLATNYAEDVVLLTDRGRFHGHEGVRESARILEKELPDAEFSITKHLTEDPIGFVEWSGTSPKGTVCDGADSFLVRDGKIVVQTIHYTVKPE